MMQKVSLLNQIPLEQAGKRLDQALAELFPDYSRSRIQTWIKNQQVAVNGKYPKGKEKVQGGEQIVIDAELEEEGSWQAEAIKLDVVYEDEDLLIINKPANLVVHPAPGHYSGTLVNALLHYCPELNTVPRAGIVHRIDKDTTGLLLVAKNLIAHNYLVQQLQEREIHREYQAIVYGHIISGATIEQPMGRHPHHRVKMAVVDDGKPAVTHYRVIERFRQHTHIAVQLETGRTHQIRVHMAHQGYPLVGDRTYGRLRLPKGGSQELVESIQQFSRQALHACKLTLCHPRTTKLIESHAALPTDMVRLLEILKKDYDENA